MAKITRRQLRRIILSELKLIERNAPRRDGKFGTGDRVADKVQKVLNDSDLRRPEYHRRTANMYVVRELGDMSPLAQDGYFDPFSKFPNRTIKIVRQSLGNVYLRAFAAPSLFYITADTGAHVKKLFRLVSSVAKEKYTLIGSEIPDVVNKYDGVRDSKGKQIGWKWKPEELTMDALGGDFISRTVFFLGEGSSKMEDKFTGVKR